MIRYILLIAALALSLASLSFHVDANSAVNAKFDDVDWLLRIDKHRLQTYTSTIRGSNYQAVKIELLADVAAADILQAFGNGASCIEWVASCHSANLLETISDSQQLVYLVIKIPLPFIKKRDVVIDVVTTTNQSSGVIRRLQTDLADRMLDTKYVRMKMDSKLEIVPLSDRQSKLTWYSHVEFGGSLSATRVNNQAYKTNHKDFAKLAKLLAN